MPPNSLRNKGHSVELTKHRRLVNEVAKAQLLADKSSSTNTQAHLSILWRGRYIQQDDLIHHLLHQDMRF